MRALLLAAVATFGVCDAATAQTNARPAFYVGTNAGGRAAQVNAYDVNGQLLAAVTPYAGFTGGARVASGDVNGDGRSDLIVGAGPGGGPHVKVFDGRTGGTIRDSFVFEPAFQGGVRVAAGDLDGDGRAEVVAGAGAGGEPHVKVFSGTDGSVRQNFFAFDQGFVGGVTVATGDFAGDGQADLIVAAGAGGGPRIRVFDGVTNAVRADFFAFDQDYIGDLSLATGTYLGQSALFVGAGAGNAPVVKVFALADARLIGSFLAFQPSFTGGVNIAFARIGGRDTLFAATASSGGSVRSMDVSGRRAQGEAAFTDMEFTPFGPDYADGLFVAGVADAVPEPATWAQLLLGFLLLGSARLRRVPAHA